MELKCNHTFSLIVNSIVVWFPSQPSCTKKYLLPSFSILTESVKCHISQFTEMESVKSGLSAANSDVSN